MDAVLSLPTIESLRDHIFEVLCQHDQLEPTQTPLFQSLVTRGNRTCGLFFQVQGPRMVKTYAVWAADESRILFYDSQGTRFAETKLTESPDPKKIPIAGAPIKKAA